MMDKEKYKRELVRMWDSIRHDEYDEYEGGNDCFGVECGKCPLDLFCNSTSGENIYNLFEINETVEKWSKKHPPKHKVSQTEFEILKSLYKYSSNLVQFGDFRFLLDMIEKGYFDGANGSTYINTYIDLCDVEEK